MDGQYSQHLVFVVFTTTVGNFNVMFIDVLFAVSCIVIFSAHHVVYYQWCAYINDGHVILNCDMLNGVTCVNQHFLCVLFLSSG